MGTQLLKRIVTSRFTLVELMIVVAIISILAAVAIPSLHSMQMRANRAEVAPIIDAFDKGFAAARAADSLSTIVYGWSGDRCRYVPRDITALDKSAVPWPSTSDCREVSVVPDGAVRCTYGHNGAGDELFAYCDIDANGDYAHARWQWNVAPPPEPSPCDMDATQGVDGWGNTKTCGWFQDPTDVCPPFRTGCDAY